MPGCDIGQHFCSVPSAEAGFGQAESAKIHKFQKIPSVFVELWWDSLGAWAGDGLGSPRSLRTRSEVGSCTALELLRRHLVKMKVINLQLVVMVTKMWLFPQRGAGTTHPFVLLGEGNGDALCW